MILGLYGDNGKENGNYYNGLYGVKNIWEYMGSYYNIPKVIFLST